MPHTQDASTIRPLDAEGIKKRRDRFNDLVAGLRADFFEATRNGSKALTEAELQDYRTALGEIIKAMGAAELLLGRAYARFNPPAPRPSQGHGGNINYAPAPVQRRRPGER